jgi:excisionase family DNA binding protein
MEKKPERKPLLWTLQQAAVETGVPYTSLYQLVVEGHLACVRLGNSRRIWVKRTDLERLIENSTMKAS